MRILLDTNIVLWAMGDHPKLSSAARREIERASIAFVSAASIWEISIKTALHKLGVDMDELLPRLTEAEFEPLAVSWDHGRIARDLPHHHRDPFGRMLVAQAIGEPLRLLTHDAMLKRYSDLVVIV